MKEVVKNILDFIISDKTLFILLMVNLFGRFTNETVAAINQHNVTDAVAGFVVLLVTAFATVRFYPQIKD